MTTSGLLLVSHVPELAVGVQRLLMEVAKDVPITIAGGTESDEIGTSMDKVLLAIEQNPADEIFAFFDLGSARMNIEMAQEFASKPVKVYDAAFIEGSYTAAALLQAGATSQNIEEQLQALLITK